MNNITIAIADDHTPYRNAVRELLTTYGYYVSIDAKDGKDLNDALNRASQLPDACVIDINMPKMDGFETVRNIRKQWPEMKILAFSVNTEKWRKETILKNGADIFLNKGLPPKTLDDALTKLCQKTSSSYQKSDVCK